MKKHVYDLDGHKLNDEETNICTRLHEEKKLLVNVCIPVCAVRTEWNMLFCEERGLLPSSICPANVWVKLKIILHIIFEHATNKLFRTLFQGRMPFTRYVRTNAFTSKLRPELSQQWTFTTQRLFLTESKLWQHEILTSWSSLGLHG